jgi:hypothetical protein
MKMNVRIPNTLRRAIRVWCRLQAHPLCSGLYAGTIEAPHTMLDSQAEKGFPGRGVLT